MKYLTLLVIVSLLNLKVQAQKISIECDEKIVRTTDGDTLIVQEGSEDKIVRIKLIMTGTDKSVDVNVYNSQNLQHLAAKRNLHYDFDIIMPIQLTFNKQNKMTNIIDFKVKNNGVINEPNYVMLDFKWQSLTEENKELNKTLYIKIYDNVTKVIKKQRKDSRWVHVDSTNTNKIELSQFTDFMGFENDKPNGRLQQEFRFKWGIAKKWYGKEDSWQIQFLRSVILPDILINRIDKSQKEETYNYPAYLKMSSNLDSSAPKFTTMDILKYSNLQIGARVVLLAFKKNNFRFHIQGGIKLIRNKPYADTSLLQTGKTDSSIFRPTYSIAYTAEIYGKTTLSEKNAINLDFNAGIMFLYLKDSYYRQYDAAVIDPYNKATVLLPVSYPARKVRPMYMFSLRLTKDLTEEKDHYVYFRCNYIYQTGKYNTVTRKVTTNGNIIYIPNLNPVRFYNHFLQLQLGVSLDINELFQKRSTDKKTLDTKISDSAG